jgi:signal transduction histidine kinase
MTPARDLQDTPASVKEVLADLREANENLVMANLRSQALASEVEKLYAEASQAIQAKDEFFEQVTHELRTPMTSITGWAALLGRETDPTTIAEAARSIASSAAVQAKLVNDLLDMSRMMMQTFNITIAEVDLRGVVLDAVSAARPLADSKHLSLEVELTPILVPGDATRLRQVLDNLLSNAVKFTHAGGEIKLSLTLNEGEGVLIVRDNGEGVPVDFLPRVFDRHAQASIGRFGGLGLGLAIVKHIVELHGGSVIADSAGEGMGTTFTVRLPASEPNLKS